MFGRLLLVFLIVPIVELAILVQIGRWIGLWGTLALVLVTAIVGAALARSQGARVIRDLRAEMAAGRVPGRQLLDGVLVLIGGIVLLTPGVLTDVLGFVLLLPPTRKGFRRLLARAIQARIIAGGVARFTLRP